MANDPDRPGKKDVPRRYSDPLSALKSEMDSLFDSFMGGLPAFSGMFGTSGGRWRALVPTLLPSCSVGLRLWKRSSPKPSASTQSFPPRPSSDSQWGSCRSTQIQLLVWTAVINGIVAVPIMAMMMLIVTNRSAMGRFRARPSLAWAGWTATGLMGITVLALLWAIVR